MRGRIMQAERRPPSSPPVNSLAERKGRDNNRVTLSDNTTIEGNMDDDK